MASTHAPGSSLTVLGGPRDGTVFALGTSFEELFVGSDSSCHVCLDLPGVSPIHANLLVEAAGVTVRDTHSPFGLYVNDDPVQGPVRLRDGDVLWLGPPGEPQSVMLLCHIVALVPPVAAPPTAPGMDWDPSLAGVAEQPRDTSGDLVLLETEAATADAVTHEEPVETFLVDEPPAEPPPPPVVAAAVEEPEFFVDPVIEIGTAAVPAAPPAPLRPPPQTAPPLPAEPEGELFFFSNEPAGEPTTSPPPLASTTLDPVWEPEAAPLVDEAAEEVPETLAVPSDELRAAAAAVRATSAPPPPPPAPPPTPELRPLDGPPPDFSIDDSMGIVAPVPPVAAPPTPPKTAAAPPRPAAQAAAPRPAAPARAPSEAKPARPAPPAARRPAAPAPATRAPRRASGSGSRTFVLAGVALLVLAVLAGAGWYFLGGPRLDSVQPARAHGGQVVTLQGARLDPGVSVLFGDQPGRVVKAAGTTLEVEVPDVARPGSDIQVPLVVRAGPRSSRRLALTVFVAPRLHGISPDVALPGEVVELAGTHWGEGAEVTFGGLRAEVLAVRSDSIRVRVPAIEGPAGTPASVVVKMGGSSSNPAPFFVGRLPLIIQVQPPSGAVGDLLRVSGRGFGARGALPAVSLGGRRALVVSASDTSLSFVVPWGLPAGSAALEVRVPGLDLPAEARIELGAPAESVELLFAAEALDEAADGSLAAVGTELGPAFVLAAARGQSAAQRAVDAAGRLNQAVVAVKASLSADFEVRFSNPPSVGLRGRPEALLEATPEDAAAYAARSGGRPVSPARLALWWTALARDLALLLVRSERPHHAADTAPEGRALVDAFQAARRASSFGVARAVLADPRLPRAGLRALALRVPAGVPEPAGVGTAGPPTTAAGPGATPAPAAAPLRLEGTWVGVERVPEGRRDVSVRFEGRGGTFALESGLSLSLPLISVEQPQRGAVRFSLRLGGGLRYYNGRWDGERITGSVSSDAAGREGLGSFELAPR